MRTGVLTLAAAASMALSISRDDEPDTITVRYKRPQKPPPEPVREPQKARVNEPRQLTRFDVDRLARAEAKRARKAAKLAKQEGQ